MICHKLLANRIGALLLLLPLCQTAAQESGKVLDQGGGKVLGLVFRVEDIGGKTQDFRVRESAAEVRIELAADVLFDFDKAEILPKAQSALKQAAAIVRDKARGAVRIEGHTDAKGSDAYNQKLSERRALAVKAWLTDKEVLRNAQFLTQGFGARKPKASNQKPDGADDPEGRQQNRRVEIIFKK